MTGVALADLARRELFEPLALRRTFFNPERAMQTGVAACESTGNAYEREMCRDEAGAAAAKVFREGLIWGEVHDGNAYFLAAPPATRPLRRRPRHAPLAEQFLPAPHRSPPRLHSSART